MPCLLSPQSQNQVFHITSSIKSKMERSTLTTTSALTPQPFSPSRVNTTSRVTEQFSVENRQENHRAGRGQFTGPYDMHITDTT